MLNRLSLVPVNSVYDGQVKDSTHGIDATYGNKGEKVSNNVQNPDTTIDHKRVTSAESNTSPQY